MNVSHHEECVPGPNSGFNGARDMGRVLEQQSSASRGLPAVEQAVSLLHGLPSEC